MLTAAARALHREEQPPWVLDDRFALGLAGDGGAEMVQLVRERLTREELQSFARWVCVRARFCEDEVQRGVTEGIGQYVILGAGLDSFAYRHPELLDQLHVFEVDHPSSQAWKRSRLAELGVVLHPNVAFVPVDFEKETLRRSLIDSGFDSQAPAVFSWIGVTMYLTTEAIRATLEDLVSYATGSRLIVTYNQPGEVLDDFSRKVTAELAGVVGEGGEPFLTLLTAAEVETIVREAGFVDVRHFGADEARRTYFGNRQHVAIAGAQRLLTAAVP